MILGRKVDHFGIIHCINCCGAMEIDISAALPYGPVHEVCCPHCNIVQFVDITAPSILHRFHDPLEDAFR